MYVCIYYIVSKLFCYPKNYQKLPKITKKKKIKKGGEPFEIEKIIEQIEKKKDASEKKNKNSFYEKKLIYTSVCMYKPFP